MKTIGEMILELVAAREERAASAEGLITKAAAENRDLSEADATAFDTFMKEIEGIDARIKRLERLQAIKAAGAQRVKQLDLHDDAEERAAEEEGEEGEETQEHDALPATTRRRGVTGPAIVGRRSPTGRTLEKGEAFGQLVRCIAVAKMSGGGAAVALQFAKHQKMHPSVIKALASNAAGSGQDWVATEFANDFIELLVPKMVVRRSGPRVIQLPAGVGKLILPRLTAGGSAGYVGENQPIPYTQVGTGVMDFVPKKLGAITAMSREVLRRTTPSIDRVVRDNLLEACALRADIQMLRGTASSIAPAGIRNLAASGNIIAMTASPTIATVIQDLDTLELLITNANVPKTRMAWFLAPRVETFIKQQRDANGNFYWREEMRDGTINNIPYFVTTAIPTNLGVGTNQSEIILGDMDQFVICDEIDVTVQVSDEAAYVDAGASLVSAFSLDQIVIKVITSHDTDVRYPEAFAVLTGVTWGT